MTKREYIRSVLSVFAKSPFRPLHVHATKGGDAVRKLDEELSAYFACDMPTVARLNNEVDILEHEADIIKQTIRAELSSSIMLPVNADDLLNFLKPQDSICDECQDAAYWLTLRDCQVPKELEEGFRELMSRTLATVEMYELLVDTLSELLESSFGKKDVEETLELVSKVEEMEHQVDLMEKQLMKTIFEKEELLDGGGVYFFVELTKNIGRIADRTESAADRLRTMVLRR